MAESWIDFVFAERHPLSAPTCANPNVIVLFVLGAAVAAAGAVVAAASGLAAVFVVELPQPAVTISMAEANKSTPNVFLDFICCFLPLVHLFASV
ncbi:hypothetical protein D3C71_1721910 [compost metagenome]